MRWFGESWKAPVCETTEQIETPVGLTCAPCGKLIGPDDRGLLIPTLTPVTMVVTPDWKIAIIDDVPHIAYHLRCLLQSILGNDAMVISR